MADGSGDAEGDCVTDHSPLPWTAEGSALQSRGVTLAIFHRRGTFQPTSTDEANAQLVLRALDIVEAWDRSEFDISTCRFCSLPVVCIPDGLAICAKCAEKEGGR